MIVVGVFSFDDKLVRIDIGLDVIIKVDWFWILYLGMLVVMFVDSKLIFILLF